jgi:hypothetical protein
VGRIDQVAQVVDGFWGLVPGVFNTKDDFYGGKFRSSIMKSCKTFNPESNNSKELPLVHR